jgi:acyl-homoserine-lactone acylase
MKFLILLNAILLAFSCVSQAQTINPTNIQIVRDQWGVPHIYAQTDAEVAYGLAWAHCEDDFENVQKALLSGKNMLGRSEGKDGALFDFALQYTGLDTFVDVHYESSFSDDFKLILKAYAQGVNDFAKTFPNERLVKKAFPFNEKDIIRGYAVKMSLMAGFGLALKAVNDNKIEEYMNVNETGSNAVAVSKKRTEDNKTWLVINSHQPMEGELAWYEAHLNSEDGWNTLGGLFPGGVTVFVGSNENLAWAHTSNYSNFGDVFKLEMHPSKKNLYQYDDEWKELGIRKARLKVKILGFVKLGVKKKIFLSEFGPVFKTKHGMYATKFPAFEEIRNAEQWYRMNKAKNFEEFEAAIKMETLPTYNVLYADKEDNLFFISDGHFPLRDSTLNWTNVMIGNTSKLNWNELHPYSRKPKVFNPSCGYLYTANHTPLEATCEGENWDNLFVGLQTFMYNRGDRFKYFLNHHESNFTWEQMMEYKYDKKYHPDGTYWQNLKMLYELDENKYPHLADVISIMKNWNLSGDIESEGAAVAMLAHNFLKKKHKTLFAMLMIRSEKITEEEAVEALTHAKNFLIKHHQSVHVPLGKIQRHIRGEKDLPIGGLSEVPRAVDASLYNKKKGVYRARSGDCYIQYVKFDENGPEITSVNAFGASSRPNSPHYTDQMEMFVNEEVKTMTLNKEEIFQNAKSIYTPAESAQKKKLWFE